MEQSTQGISRRGFLGGAALAAMGAATAGALSLSGCSPQQSTSRASSAQVEPNGSSSVVNEVNPQDETYDSFTTEYSTLFEPIQVGSLTLRNRIVKAAAGSDTGNRNEANVTQNQIDYFSNIAKGGASLILLATGELGHLGVNPAATKLAVENEDDGIELLKPLAAAVHEQGSYIGYQVSTPGMPGTPPIVNDITVEEIKAFVAKTAECAARLQAAGFDVLEIKGATTDTLNGFLSARENQREDEYGVQSIENRARFFVEMIEAVKDACGKDFTVAVLINAVEECDNTLGMNDKFLTIEESSVIAQELERAGADMIQIRVATNQMEASCWAPDCNHAGYHADGMTGLGTQFDYRSHFEGLQDGSHHGAGAFIPMASAIKSAVSVPVGCAGYMDPRTTPDIINNALSNGDIDLVFMNRPLTVDPELPNKLQAGKRDEVAPCTRCFHCHDQTLHIPECCRVNATTQHAYTEAMPEGYKPLPATEAKNVMVIGGGPAGMEAARIAAERGHNVTLYEKGGSLGGLVKSAQVFKGSHERLNDLLAYLTKQQELKGVTVVTDTEVDAAFVNEKSPDTVIVATGGSRESKLSGDKIVDIMDVASASIGERVVILGAGAQAIDLALYLLAQGKSIQIVHEGTQRDVDKEQSAWFQQFIPPHLAAHGVKIWNEATIGSVVDSGISITTPAGHEKTLECDTIVEAYDMVPNTSLADEISGTCEVVSVGDCAVPYNIQQAIYTANIAARAI